jgi:hypothetical protein
MKAILTIAAVMLVVAGCSSRETAAPSESTSIPQRNAYSNQTDFLRARVEYYTTDWVKRNPDKPWHYTPAVPIVKVTNGVWGMETGPAVVAGHGLFVTVDDSGHLIEIKEIFNPD